MLCMKLTLAVLQHPKKVEEKFNLDILYSSGAEQVEGLMGSTPCPRVQIAVQKIFS